MTVSLHRVSVALKRPTNVSAFIVYARAIVTAMTRNSWFPAPTPPLARVGKAIDKLDQAESAALSGMRGLKQARNEALAALVSLLTRLKAYVQGVADENPDEAVSIIESAAMSATVRKTSPKPPLAVLAGRVSGSVRLVAKAAAKEANYEWQQSRGPGKAWVGLPSTLQARTGVRGLESGATYSFRVRAVTRRGAGDWCEPVSYVVQ